MTKGRMVFAPGKDQDNGVVRDVCGADCGGVDQDSRSEVPFTLQYLFTMLAGILLGEGGRWRSAGAGIGRAADLFAQGGGLSYLLQPSFGYLIGICCRRLCHRDNGRSGPVTFRRLLAANLVGLGVVYLFGMLYYYGICQVLGTPLVLAFVSVWICWPSRGICGAAVCGGGCFGHAPKLLA